MDVIGIIQARLGSTRLPGKILAPIAGRPMLELITERLRTSHVDEWWLATSADRADDTTEAWGHALGLRVFRGDNENVLSRYTAIIREREPGWVVRVTGDNPFVSGEAVDLLVDARDGAGKGMDLIEFAGDENGARSLPLGFGLQLANAQAVLASEAEIPDTEPHHFAHVVSKLAQSHRVRSRGHGTTGGEESREVKCCPTPDHWPARPSWRWTVDTFDDLTMARAAFEVFGRDAGTIGYAEMVERLDACPTITAHNQDVVQKKLVEG